LLSRDNLIWPKLIVFDSHDRLPTKSRRVLDDVQFRRTGTIEDCIEPVIVLEAFGGPEFVLAQSNDTNAGAAFDFDEPDLDECLRVFGVRSARDQVEASVLGFYALDTPAAFYLMPRGDFDRNAFNFVVANHRSYLRIAALRMWGHPGSAEVRDVRDRAMPFEFQLALSRFESVVKFVQMLFGLRNQAI